MVNVYDIHNLVHKNSPVFAHPRFLRALLEHEQGEKVSITRSKPDELSEMQQIEAFESHRKLVTDLSLRKKLQEDYSTMLYATIAPRAALMQLIPYVSMLSIFASFTARYPIFVYSPY